MKQNILIDFKTIQNYLKEYNRIINQGLKDLAETYLNTKKILSKAFIPIFTVIAERLKEYPEQTRKALEILASEGWYIPSMELPFNVHLKFATMILSNENEKVDEAMCLLIEENLNSIEQEIIKNSPKRETFIHKAFNAHREKNYVISIPLLLIHADGINQDLAGFSYFIKKKDKEKFVKMYEEDPLTGNLSLDKNDEGQIIQLRYGINVPVVAQFFYLFAQRIYERMVRYFCIEKEKALKMRLHRLTQSIEIQLNNNPFPKK